MRIVWPERELPVPKDLGRVKVDLVVWMFAKGDPRAFLGYIGDPAGPIRVVDGMRLEFRMRMSSQIDEAEVGPPRESEGLVSREYVVPFNEGNRFIQVQVRILPEDMGRAPIETTFHEPFTPAITEGDELRFSLRLVPS